MHELYRRREFSSGTATKFSHVFRHAVIPFSFLSFFFSLSVHFGHLIAVITEYSYDWLPMNKRWDFVCLNDDMSGSLRCCVG